MSSDSLLNVGEYVSAHYLAEVLPKELKRERLATWAKREKAGEQTPRTQLRALRQDFFTARALLGQDSSSLAWRKTLDELHEKVLTCLGFEMIRDLCTVEYSGVEYNVPVLYQRRGVVAIECGWATDVDAALDSSSAGLLPLPVLLHSGREVTSGAELASFFFSTEDPPRYVVILVGAVMILADRHAWGEGRYLAVNLDTALGRNDTTLAGELDTIAALFSAEALHAPSEGGDNPLAALVDAARKHAVGVSSDLRKGLQRSVELIANEVLGRIREANVEPDQLDDVRTLERTLTRQSLRYLYRMLFLLYAEARPDLGVLPADYPEYSEGYGMARLGELATHPLVDEASRTGFHLHESLDLLFRLVNNGYRSRAMGETSTSEDEGIRFEKLNSDLFSPGRVTMIGRIRHPAWDPDEPGSAPEYIDTRLRNETLHQVLYLLMVVRGKKKERGGFISYAQLGINQLGAVYEGLMSYTGFIATEELYEVAKNGDPSDGSWMVPATKADQYPDSVFVVRINDETGEKHQVRYPKGSFVYRLAGRDRQMSASYYTPESLTKVTVQLTLQQRINEHPGEVKASDLLTWKICEPALGSGAFLNEAINQVAAEYLRRRQEELNELIPPEDYDTELRRVKAYVALHNSYGVDLNDTAVELAEVSLWLNVMHPGLAAPWFGLHLRRGNSLIGANRRFYSSDQLTKAEWLRTKDPLPPTELPFRDGALPDRAVHQFLLPAIGWAAVASEKEARALAPEETARLAAWRKGIHAKPKKGKQVQRLQGLARRAEFLWRLVIQRLEISEREISRRINVWGASALEHPPEAIDRQDVYDDLHAQGTPYWRLKTLMNTWCALWFWPVHQSDLLDGTASVYADSLHVAAQAEPAELPAPRIPLPFAEQTSLLPTVQESLFGEAAEVTASSTTSPRKPKIRRRPVVALQNLDDWLEFAEALLGTSDLGDDHLFSDITTLHQLDELESELPGQMGMDNEFLLPQRFPWLGTVEDLSQQHVFFHWELDFAHLFNRGGFDLQLGNPPWVRPDWDEVLVLAERHAWFGVTEQKTISDTIRRQCKDVTLKAPSNQAFYLEEMATQSAIAVFLTSTVAYRLLTGSRPDLYRAFMVRTWANSQLTGATGMLHPDSHFNGERDGALRSAAYRRLRVHSDFANEKKLFPPPIGHKTHFGLHIYGQENQLVNFRHLSWIFLPSTLTESLDWKGGPVEFIPGVKSDGTWDTRPHPGRAIQVDTEMLTRWTQLTGKKDTAVDETKLLYPVSTFEQDTITILGTIASRLGSQKTQISGGYNEKTAKDNGVIKWTPRRPASWSEVILQGPHIGVATPFFKQAPRMGSTDRPQDLTKLTPDSLPGTNYCRATNQRSYIEAQDHWIDFPFLAKMLKDPNEIDRSRLTIAKQQNILPRDVTDELIETDLQELSKRPYTDFYRLAWREMIASNTDRSLFAALIPPGAAHVHAVRTMTLATNRETALVCGFWAALPIDYLLRAGGIEHLDVRSTHIMPTPDVDHPLEGPLLLRTLRLNCLTNAYSPLWTELYDESWQEEKWAVDWHSPERLGKVAKEWTMHTPLRNERERRATLTEIDALVAAWLGIQAEQLITIYRSRYPVLSDYEDATWFDANGRKIAGNFNTYGHGQTKEHFHQLMAHLEDGAPPPEGYTPPFYKADRVAEMRQAHEVFSKRLEESR